MAILVDLLTDDDGDLVVSSSGDISLAEVYRTSVQAIINRIRTNFMESDIHPHMGANLQARIGYPNNEINGDWIKERVLQSLTKDGRFTNFDVTVDVVPIAKDEILILVYLDAINYGDPVANELQVLTFLYNYTVGTIERITD